MTDITDMNCSVFGLEILGSKRTKIQANLSAKYIFRTNLDPLTGQKSNNYNFELSGQHAKHVVDTYTSGIIGDMSSFPIILLSVEQQGN